MWMLFGCDLESESGRDSAYFTGLIFELFGDFSPFWSISTLFLGRFSHFDRFFWPRNT
jgi:hypothetical protein